MPWTDCENGPDCGLLHDERGNHAPEGHARGSRRALHHHPGECSAFRGSEHPMYLCPVLTVQEKTAIRLAADAAMERDGWTPA